jgi:predicted DNA-binding antitoxin AbrB/MazE fold protein
MSKRLEVIYENGVFRPLESVDVSEHQRMTTMLPEASVVPPEHEIEHLPSDAAERHDHYIYGTPQKPA